MSLETNLSNLTTRIATEFKVHKGMINGNAVDLSGLSTTAKTSLVAAINELDSEIATIISSGSATSLVALTDTAIASPATGHILRYDGTTWANVSGATYFEVAGAAAAAAASSQPLDTDLTAIAALATSVFGRNLLTLADQAALTGQIAAATETVAGKLEIATTAEVTTATDDTRTVTPLKLQQRLAAFAQPLDSDLTAIAALATSTYGRALLTLADQAALMALLSSATTTTQGIVELATATETTAGTDSNRAVTPAGIKPALDAKASITSLAAVALSGNAADLTGTLPASALPALAVTNVNIVASQSAMLALVAQEGDVAKRTDTGRTYFLAAAPASTLTNWVEVTAAGDVLSVAGKTGAVTLTKNDVGLSNVDNTSDASKPVSTATQTALNAKQGLDTTLTALAGLTTAANQTVYSTGADAFAMTGLTAFGRSLIDDADAAAARGTMDVYAKSEVYTKTDIGNPEQDLVAVFNAGLA